jgi:hypothetical protein
LNKITAEECSEPKSIYLALDPYFFFQTWSELFLKNLVNIFSKHERVKFLVLGQPKVDFPIDYPIITSSFEENKNFLNKCKGGVFRDISLVKRLFNRDYPKDFKGILFASHEELIDNRPFLEKPCLQLKVDKSYLDEMIPQKIEDFFFPPPMTACPSFSKTQFEKSSEIGVVILAGGLGSRLGMNGPKGLFPINGKPLFAHLLDKIPKELPLAVMTSKANHELTLEYFTSIGRKAYFFVQSETPMYDASFSPQGLAPDGNGSFFQSFNISLGLKYFESLGVSSVIVNPVDNPLLDPVDPCLLSFHKQLHSDVTVKCVKRIRGESMGAITQNGILEYFEMLEDNYHYSYVGQVVFSIAFLKQAAKAQLPLHWVQKNGLWKGERLIFDAFSLADRFHALCFDREDCYAPIKGRETVETVEKRLRMK